MKFSFPFVLIIVLLASSACLSTGQDLISASDILRAKGISIEKSLFFDEARIAMVEEQLKGRGIKDQRILEVMSRIEREEFIPADYQLFAYDDGALPIAEGRSIPQPYVIAVMIEALNLQGGDRVLAIGDGSGYQTAILAELSEEV
ncbi:MAG: protein-L-isoaspartate O-methyltransferase, partial [Candidatus Hydrothermarchaeales archaeon]